jgi:hypothetical protein
VQEGYFGCMGCGRTFKFDDDVEIAEYGLHDCNEPENRLIVPGYLPLFMSILDRLRRN